MTDERMRDQLSLDLLSAAARFTRTAGRVPGFTYSAVAWRVLSRLLASPCRVNELAALHNVAQPTMTSLVNRLASEAWVARERDPEDGRAILVRITDDGREALADYRATAAAAIDPLLAELGADDRAILARASALMQSLADRAAEGEAPAQSGEPVPLDPAG